MVLSGPSRQRPAHHSSTQRTPCRTLIRNLYFDLTEVVAGAMGSAESMSEIAGWIRRIGLGRVLHGSDATTAGGASAAQRWAEFRHRIPLTDAELRDIADNVAPYLR